MGGVVISGAREFGAAIDSIMARERVATRQAIAQLLHMIEKEAKTRLSQTAGGAQGRDTKGRFTRRGTFSSPPGEPPFLVTGNLRRSITVDGPNPRGPNGWEGQVGPTAIYGRIQELGGMAGIGGRSILPARPYMQPAFEAVMPLMVATYRQAWARALRVF